MAAPVMSLLLTLLLAPKLRTLILSGGPNPQYNQAAIESNARYFPKVLPNETPYRLLFADGDPASKNVRYTPEGARRDEYRAPELPRLDGPSKLASAQAELSALAKDGKNPVFLYFTGHGSLTPDIKPAISQFDMWGRRERMTSVDLAKSLAEFPKDVKVAILMVQCHSGGFTDILFKDGDPTKGLAENRVCGFFASTKERVAAGCTPSINEKEYRDFTTYFVAALAEVDRLGNPLKGADYDRNRKVEMDEAFCYALINDDSIDTPVNTVDAFVRQFGTKTDAEVFATPYRQLMRWASPAQKAALEALSSSLNLTSEGRLGEAYAKYANLSDKDMDLVRVRGYRFVRLAKTIVLTDDVKHHKDRAVKRRLNDLISDEHRNPLRG